MKMPPFVPPLYPDELLYSLLARVRWLTCSESPKQDLDEFFGSRHVRAGVLMQSDMARLCRRLPRQRRLTPESLTREATLFPYFTAFHPPEIQKWALSLLIEGNADAVHVRLGLVASTVRPPILLRYCPSCRSEMLTEYNELYWIRAHQLPGVLVCPHHSEPLLDSMVKPASLNQHEYIAPDESNCPPYTSLSTPKWDPAVMRLLIDIARRSANLLKNPPRPRASQSWSNFYHSELVLRGFGKGPSNLDQESLRQAYIAHFDPILSVLPEAAPDSWLPGITRKHRKAIAPLRHILLQMLLDTLPPTKSLRPFGCGPWPCRNPLADHSGKPVVTSCSTHREGGKTIGVFRCSCGYAFSRAAETKSRIRILDMSPLFEIRLRELVAAGTSLRKTARILVVDSNTVRRYASRFGLVTTWKGLPPRPKIPIHNRDVMRAKWSAGHLGALNLSRKQLRSRMPGVYAWLYRHDRRWLAAQPPEPMRRHDGKQRRDWPVIDETTAEELKRCAALLRTENPPMPVTRSALERFLGKPRWLETRLDKLPLCAAALNELTESVPAIQCRRVTWAADELRRLDKPVIAWRIRRLAGLPDHCVPVVEAALRVAERRAQ